MRRALVRVALAGCLAAATAAGAEEPAAGTASLETCLQRGLALARQKGLFDSQVTGARAAVDAARAESSLQLNVSPGIRYNAMDGRWLGEAQADLGERLLELPQNRVRKNLAAGRLTSSEYRRERMAGQYAAGIVRAFAACLSDQQVFELAEERARLAEQAAGAWTQLDASTRAFVEQREKALATAREAQAGRELAREALLQSRRHLGVLSGLGEAELARCQEPPGYTPPSVPLERCLAWARERRSDLTAARHEAGLMEQSVSLARMERWPRPRLSFGYMTDDATDEAELLGRLVVQIPLWDAGLTKARAAELSAQHAGLRFEAETLAERIAGEVTRSYLKLQQAASSLRNLVQDPLPAQEFQMADVKWKNGQISRIDFEQARLRLLESRARIAMQRWDCLEAEADLQDAVQATREELAAGLPLASAPGAGPGAAPAGSER